MSLSKEDIEKWARWYNSFNMWEYPEDFLVKKPNDWDTLSNWNDDKSIRTKSSLSRPYMNMILMKIGHKETLRYHHKKNMGMNNFQFETWWFSQWVNRTIRFWFSKPNFYFDVYSFFKWYNY